MQRFHRNKALFLADALGHRVLQLVLQPCSSTDIHWPFQRVKVQARALKLREKKRLCAI
jgi:hypothetical protein